METKQNELFSLVPGPLPKVWGGSAPVDLILSLPALDADLTFEQTAWGDSGVYYCSVVSAQDLDGNNEAYAELIVLGEWGRARRVPGGRWGEGAGTPFVHSCVSTLCPPATVLGPVACFAPCLVGLPVTWASPCLHPRQDPSFCGIEISQSQSGDN